MPAAVTGYGRGTFCFCFTHCLQMLDNICLLISWYYYRSMTYKNYIELSRQKAMNELFSEFKFNPTRNKAALIVYQCRIMQEIGYGKINLRNLAKFRNRVWDKIKPAVMKRLRSRRYSITKAIEKQVVGK